MPTMPIITDPDAVADRLERAAAKKHKVTARHWRDQKNACNGTPAELVRRVVARYGWDPRDCAGDAYLVELADMFLAAYLYIVTTTSSYDSDHIRGSEGAGVVDVEARWAQMFDWIDGQGLRRAA